MANDTPLVLKFGGSSVGSPEKIKRVAGIVAAHAAVYQKLVVVVSAMGDTTDDLIDLAHAVNPNSSGPESRREMDMLLSSGERISMSLLSLALAAQNQASISLTGSQSGIITDEVHGEARIQDVRPTRFAEYFAQKKIVIVAGFQGVSTSKEITTLGRGGSDTSAVALAVALKAPEVRIYTDVDGLFSADPRIVPKAKRISKIDHVGAILAAERGAQVMHRRSVELAKKYQVKVRVLSTFKSEALPVDDDGTTIEHIERGNSMIESPEVNGIAAQKNLTLFQKSVALKDLSQIQTQLASRGIRIAKWTYVSGMLGLYVEPDQCALCEAALAVKAAAKGLSRVSILGTGLDRGSQIEDQLLARVSQLGAQVQSYTRDSSVLELVISGVGAEQVDELVRGLHERI
jgi:aspartate kinase